MQMENRNIVLKKRFNTFKTAGGSLKNVSHEVLIEMLRAYEQWTGSGAEFFRDIGLSKTQFAVLMKKAKKLCREGHHVEAGEFQEIAVSAISPGSAVPCASIELLDQGKVIRFPHVDQLLEFLKKAA